MVDRDQRLARRQRERLARYQPDHHPADQPRTGGGGDRIDLVERHPGFSQSGFGQWNQRLDMRARGDFRHHPAIGTMRGFLPRQFMRKDAPVRGDQSSRGFVAGGFEAKDQRHRAHLRAIRDAFKAAPQTGSQPPP